MKKEKPRIKFIIEDYTDIGDITMMDIVGKVVQEGLISNNNKQYCYVTRFGQGVVVEMIKKDYGYKVVIFKDKVI